MYAGSLKDSWKYLQEVQQCISQLPKRLKRHMYAIAILRSYNLVKTIVNNAEMTTVSKAANATKSARRKHSTDLRSVPHVVRGKEAERTSSTRISQNGRHVSQQRAGQRSAAALPSLDDNKHGRQHKAASSAGRTLLEQMSLCASGMLDGSSH